MSWQAEKEHAMGTGEGARQGAPPLFPVSGLREALMIVPKVSP